MQRESDQSDYSVIVNSVTVTFRPPSDRNFSESRDNEKLLSKITRILKPKKRGTLVAVDDVSFKVRTGESVGLVGLNGSGKSTLLRSIGGLETPTRGHVFATSQPVLLGVSAALEPALSGIENVRLGLLAMGMKPKEVSAKIPDVLEFADIGDSIHYPMNTYSSGMAARLRFAITTASQPEILLVDEALSTGDNSFVQKSKKRMRDMTSGAGTFFLVSHSSATVREFCDRAIWLHEGKLIHDAAVKETVDLYDDWVKRRGGRSHEDNEKTISDIRTEYLNSLQSN